MWQVYLIWLASQERYVKVLNTFVLLKMFKLQQFYIKAAWTYFCTCKNNFECNKLFSLIWNFPDRNQYNNSKWPKISTRLVTRQQYIGFDRKSNNTWHLLHFDIVKYVIYILASYFRCYMQVVCHLCNLLSYNLNDKTWTKVRCKKGMWHIINFRVTSNQNWQNCVHKIKIGSKHGLTQCNIKLCSLHKKITL